MKHLTKAAPFLFTIAASALLGGMMARQNSAVAQSGSGATEAASTKATRLATVDVFAVVERVWLGEQYVGPRTALADSMNKEIDALNAKMDEMRDKANKLPPESPELKTMADEFTKLQQEAQQKQRAGGDEMERLSTLQLAQAYQQVMTEAEAIAKSMGYTHVIASKTGKLEFRSTTMNGALQELLARPVVVSDSTDDITAALLAKFPEAPAQSTQPAPTQPGTDGAGQPTPATQPK